jgi:TM2 domain-containing membrane protein YozV
MTDKRILPALILCFFFGVLGVHRFYVGKIGTGLLQLLTGGGFVIWAVFDFIMIVIGSFTDKQGRKLTEWI